jgi:hypothetical protein
MAKQAIAAQFVTETQAEEVLAEVRQWLLDQPPIDQFREQLEATVMQVWAIHRAAGHYRNVAEAFRKLRAKMQQAKSALQSMQEDVNAPEMANYVGLLKLDEASDALRALNAVERSLSRIPITYFGQQEPRKGPTPRDWYSGFVRDLAEIANGIGIDVTTAGDRDVDPYDTPFTRFVFAVEKLVPIKEQSRRLRGSLRRKRLSPLAACAKRIDRAIAASAHEIGEVIPRKGTP